MNKARSNFVNNLGTWFLQFVLRPSAISAITNKILSQQTVIIPIKKQHFGFYVNTNCSYFLVPTTAFRLNFLKAIAIYLESDQSPKPIKTYKLKPFRNLTTIFKAHKKNKKTKNQIQP